MARLTQWITAKACGERIEGVVIGPAKLERARAEIPNHDKIPFGEVLSWDKARKWLGYEFDDEGFGYRPGCTPVWAWTKSWVIGIAVYDGVTWAFRIPRHPTNEAMPEMVGGEGV